VHSVVNLGLARAALDLVTAMAGGAATLTGAARLGERAYYRIGIGKAEARLRSARAFFYEAAADAWESLVAGDPLSPTRANLLRLSATNAAHTGAEVVQAAFRLAGTASIYHENRLQWIMRDAAVVTQHHFVSEAIYDSAGALFAGMPLGTPYP
jgi:alkylation response protein AidB-like acyl-CoA dehydrogenase